MYGTHSNTNRIGPNTSTKGSSLSLVPLNPLMGNCRVGAVGRGRGVSVVSREQAYFIIRLLQSSGQLGNGNGELLVSQGLLYTFHIVSQDRNISNRTRGHTGHAGRTHPGGSLVGVICLLTLLVKPVLAAFKRVKPVILSTRVAGRLDGSIFFQQRNYSYR